MGLCAHFLAVYSSDPWGHTFVDLGVEAKVAFGRPASAAQTVTRCVHWTPEVITPWCKNSLSRNPFFFLQFLLRRGLLSFRSALALPHLPVVTQRAAPSMSMVSTWDGAADSAPREHSGLAGERPLCKGVVRFCKIRLSGLFLLPLQSLKSKENCRPLSGTLVSGHQSFVPCRIL